MEILVTIQEVGAYSERQYQRQDGTTEYFKSRGFRRYNGVFQESWIHAEAWWRHHLWRTDRRSGLEEP